MARTRGFDKNGRRKGMWSPEEDRKLTDYVSKYGFSNWRQLPKKAGLSRCGKSCRLRWMNYLRPDIKRGNYTKEEEDIIIHTHAKLGNRWSAIASKLPGRSDNDIKNHWHTTLRKRQQDLNHTISYNTPQDTEESTTTSTLNPLALITTPKLTMETPLASPWMLTTTSSSGELSSMSYENGVVHCSNLESDVVSINTDGEFGGNFWTEPFSARTCTSRLGFMGSSSEDCDLFYLPESPGFHKDWPLFYDSYINHGQFPSD